MASSSFASLVFQQPARDLVRKERHKGNIYGFYVRQAQRGRKTGRALLGELLRIASENPSLEQISLAVATSQLSAIHLYRSFGFEVFGIETRALKVDGQYVDEHHMVLRLRP
jgi:ribosomal protein S18 acetylase RimI-like enzyme